MAQDLASGSSWVVTEKILAVGAIGGSGSRVIARSLMDAGVNMGGDLNASLDNLSYTYLFKNNAALELKDDAWGDVADLFREIVSGNRGIKPNDQTRRYFESCKNSISQEFSTDWYALRYELALNAILNPEPSRRGELWGWKEPNTHILADRWLNSWSNLIYIHVMRNGLDMAYSSNQRQPSLWGERILGEAWVNSPKYSLKYWCQVHRNIFHLSEIFPGRVLVVNYDKLCRDPVGGLSEFFQFLNISLDEARLLSIAKAIKPTSVGRFRDRSDVFPRSQLEYVRSLGFDVD